MIKAKINRLIYYLTIIVFLIFALPSLPAKASPDQSYSSYILLWRENRNSAQDFLKKAEASLKSGSKDLACSQQKLASRYALDAFKYLKLAKQSIDAENEMLDLTTSINSWKKLNNCNTVHRLFD
tara:strand:+ start:74 stop:448 length:375 start_codon:yes stop_codon:yes gene_type:complete